MTDPIHILPALDPLPIPAPVALFKFLHHLTLGLHFGALQLLLGGLVLATIWNIVGHASGSRSAIGASGTVAKKLTIVTTYVVNFGVPPLLFAQVLYGQALYTSSVLIGAWWIAVVFLILIAYALLYRMTTLADAGRPWWHWGVVSFTLLALVGRVFSTNMTLMLTPEAWSTMYASNPSGTDLPPTDPTMWPRFAVMFLGAFSLGALGTSLWSHLSSVADDARVFLRRWSAISAIVFLPLLGAAGSWALDSQPESVRAALMGGTGATLAYAWVGSIALAFVAALALLATSRSRSALAPVVGSVAGTTAIGLWTVLRDMVRDLTLAPKGLDVWATPVATNWVVVGIFLFSLVAGLVLLGWLVSVVARATPLEKNHV